MSNLKRINQQLQEIAKNNLSLETLERQGSDNLDFHELAVWEIKKALLAAYQLGAQENKSK